MPLISSSDRSLNRSKSCSYTATNWIMRWLILMIVVFGGTHVQAQDPVYRSINTLVGLPSNTVYSIYQDKKGFIWFAHERGLSRYDGNRFVSYRAKLSQGSSLSNVMEDTLHRIWVQDFSGNFYRTEGDSLIRESAISEVSGYGLAGIINGHWLISLKPDSLKSLDVNTGQRTSIPLRGRSMAALGKDAQAAYFFSENQLLRFDGKQIEPAIQLPATIPPVFFLIPIADGFVAFSKQRAPHAYVIRASGIQAFSLFNKDMFIQEVSRIGDEIWISTTAGAYCFSEQLEPRYNGHCFFPNHSISRIIRDYEGSYWFASIDKGVMMVPNIQTLLYPLNGDAATALTEGNPREILVGTSTHHLLSFHTQARQFKSIFQAPTNHEVLSIRYDGSKQETFLCTDRLIQLRQQQVVQEKMLAVKNTVALPDGRLAYSFASGVGFLHPQNQTEFPAALRYLEQAQELKARGRAVHYRTSDSALLAATSKGLFLFSPHQQTELLREGKTVYASSIQQMGKDVFIATYTQGILRLDEQYQLQAVTPALDLGNMYKLQVTKNHFWLLTDAGVVRILRSTGELKRFSVADGLPIAEYKDLLWQDGSLYLATSQGLVIFPVDRITKNSVKPRIAINQIQVNGQNYSAQNPLPELASDENNINISFSVLAFKHIQAHSVRYRVNQRAWQTLEPGVRMLNLQALEPGKYRIEIQVANEDQVMSAEPLIVQFSIQTPWYERPVTWIALTVLLFAAVYAYFKLRMRQMQTANRLRTKQMLLEQELQRSRLASIRSQMNPHFFFNALNTIQSYIYTNDKHLAASYLNQFSELTRMVLDMSTKDLITLSEELKALKLYLDLETMRFEGKLNYTLSASPQLIPEKCVLPPMLVQPYVENAIKHGLLHSKRPWQLTIAFEQTAEGLRITIDDNGIGRKRSEEVNRNRYRTHQSFAMSANAKRMELLNREHDNMLGVSIIDKYNELQEPQGTTVQINLPLLPSTETPK